MCISIGFQKVKNAFVFLFFLFFFFSFFKKVICSFFYYIYVRIRRRRPHFWSFFKVRKIFIDFRNLNFYQFFQGKVQVKISLILEMWYGYRCIHGGYMWDTWWIHGGYMGDTWWIHGRYMGDTWQIHGIFPFLFLPKIYPFLLKIYPFFFF